MSKLKLTIGIEKSKDFTFKDKGLIKLKCPDCECQIEIELMGLDEDKTLSPLVNWSYELYPDCPKGIANV